MTGYQKDVPCFFSGMALALLCTVAGFMGGIGITYGACYLIHLIVSRFI